MNNFEQNLEKLEQLTNNIKRSDISLEEALKNFEEGIKLAKTLEEKEKSIISLEAEIKTLGEQEQNITVEVIDISAEQSKVDDINNRLSLERITKDMAEKTYLELETKIKAAQNNIAEALKKGDFYSSRGPEIHELWFEDGQLHVTCSGAARITMTAGRRKAYVTYSHMGEPVEAASFPVAPEDNYVRITVTDASGETAQTRAYFPEDWGE